MNGSSNIKAFSLIDILLTLQNSFLNHKYLFQNSKIELKLKAGIRTPLNSPWQPADKTLVDACNVSIMMFSSKIYKLHVMFQTIYDH